MTANFPVSVIIADEEASIRNGLRSAVESMNLNIRVLGTAKNGLEAWNLIQTYMPDIIITDIRMPLCDGLNLMKKCKEARFHIDFVILSGFDDFTYAQSAIRYGAKSYLLKPFKNEELKEELKILLDEIRQKRGLSSSSAAPSEETMTALSRKLFLNQLIHNEFHYEHDLETAVKESGLSFPSGFCQVLIFSLGTGSPIDPQSLIALKHTIERHMTGFYAQVWDNETFQLTALIFPALSENLSAIHVLAHKIIEIWISEHGMRLTIGIGTPEKSLLQAGHSYAMAVTALSYQMYETEHLIFDPSVICTIPPSVSANHIDPAPLLDAIWNNDTDAIVFWYSEYIRTLFYVPMPSPSFIRGMCIYLVTDIQNTLKKQTEDWPELVFEPPYIRINEFSFFRQIKDWCLSQFLQYGKVLSEYKSFGKDRIIAKAKRFIENNINRKISAELIAEAVNLSPSYFTIYFKSKTGINFRDYLLSRKMEQAKHLLMAADANISEISCAVGYDDYRSFYRAFKNYTGQTPSEYQTKCRGGDSVH